MYRIKQIAVAVLILVVGFFLGMEYKKYQIRTAFKEVTDTFSSAFGDGTSETTTKKAEEVPSKLIEKIDLEIVGKDFVESDYMNGVYEDSITLSIKLLNKTDKDIRGVKGVLKLYDIFEDEIDSSNISYDEEVPAESSIVWKASHDYNPFIDSDEKLKNTELKNIKYKWFPSTIIYADGTTESE